MPKRSILYLLLLITVESWAQGFSPEALFPISNSVGIYSPSYQGYGWLTPAGVSSEAGLITKEGTACLSKTKKLVDLKKKLNHEQFTYLNLMNAIYDEENAEVLGSECLVGGQSNVVELNLFKKLFTQKGYYYQKSSGRDRFIFSNDEELWGKVSKKVRSLNDKYLALKESISPLRTLLVIYTLEFLKNKKDCLDENQCLDERNLDLMLKRSHPLISVGNDYSLYQVGLGLISEILKKDSNELKEYFLGLKYHFSLTEYKRKIGRRFKSFSKRADGGPEAFRNYMQAYEDSRKKMIHQARENLCLGESNELVERQVLAEKGEVPCFNSKERVSYQCSGVKVKKNEVTLSGHFYLQGFMAFRDYKISMLKERPKVEMVIPVVKSSKLNVSDLESTLGKWEKWVNDFYNTSNLAKFKISFIEVEEDREDTINLHQCWNTSWQSDDCSLGTQPSAKNYTIDMKKDALLEEVGHRMGLFDEYSMYYYLFNPQGARDSFMVAPINFRLYPHHIEQILAPAVVCKEDFESKVQLQ